MTREAIHLEPAAAREIEALRERLADTEAVLRAIRAGEIDAVMVESESGPKAYTLEGADHAYRVLVETINEGAATLDEAATTLYCNSQLGSLLEAPLDQLIGTNFAHWVAPEHQAEFARLTAAARSGRCRGEVMVRTRTGATLPVLLSFSPLPLEANALACVVVTDLSEAYRNARLAAEGRRAKEADRRKDEFLAMLAHELRNPLAPIRNATELLARTTPGQPLFNDLLGMIRRQVAQMTRLVDDLLDVARISQGKITLQREVVELQAIARVALETVQPLLDSHHHELELGLPQHPLSVRGDAARLTQIVGNILSNAAKYTEPGGHIELTLRQVGTAAQVRVKDNGIGIPAALLPRIFDWFVQGERAPDRSQAGLGVGLSLVKHLVEAHGGWVDVHSELGKGSEFIIQLPLVQAPALAPARAGEQTPAPARKRVLVVDDNHDAAESMAMLLSLNAHEVQTAHDGRAALDLARRFQPDIVFLDIGLPAMSGYEVARQLRACEETRDARLIALTGYGQEEDRRRSREAGFDHHLVKPIDPQLLQELLG